MFDREPRGLLIPAWRGGRALAIVAEGEFAGLTVAEVAAEVGCSPDYARKALEAGQLPEATPGRGRRATRDTIERRRDAGIPEALVGKTVPEIARALGLTQHQVNQAIYFKGPRIDELRKRQG